MRPSGPARLEARCVKAASDAGVSILCSYSSAGQPSASPPVAGAASTLSRIRFTNICTASSPTIECAATHRRATSWRSSPRRKPIGFDSPSTFISILKRCVAAAAPASAHQPSPSVHWSWAAASAAMLHSTRHRRIAATVAPSLRRIPSLRGCPLSSLVTYRPLVSHESWHRRKRGETRRRPRGPPLGYLRSKAVRPRTVNGTVDREMRQRCISVQ